jgi:hypothetical protein
VPKLTEKFAASFVPAPGAKNRLAFGTETRGLGLGVTANGDKVFLVQWTDPATKRKVREPLCAWGSMSLDPARTAAKARLGRWAARRASRRRDEPCTRRSPTLPPPAPRDQAELGGAEVQQMQTGASAAPQQSEIVGVRVPAGSAARRNPLVLVEVSFGEVRVTYAVVALKGRKIAVRPPETLKRVGEVQLSERPAGIVGEPVWAKAKNSPAAGAALRRPPSDRRLTRQTSPSPQRAKEEGRTSGASRSHALVAN